jgi:acyl dehydratase
MPLDLSIVGTPTAPASFSYTWRDTVLYALGIGARREELDYLYEGRGPKVYPSFAVVPMFGPMLEVIARTGGDLAMVVHGGQRVVVRKPFSPSGTLATTATARAIYDLRRFASVLIDTETKDGAGEVVCTSTASIIFRGAGGFGGAPPPKEPSGIDVPKDREPDFSVEETTSPEQALLYRLSGDLNPLHADPEFARNVGFEKGPILHGLATYGYMVRHAAKGACGGDASRITGFDAQFRKPVWPGDTLVTRGWRVGPGRIALSVAVKEREETVVTGAWATTTEAEA